MGELLIDLEFIFLLFLFVLGIIYIFQQVANKTYSSYSDISPTVVLVIKDFQNQIEGIVRNYYGNSKNQKDLWIIDNGSQDQTKEILERISLKYPEMKIVFWSNVSPEVCFEKLLSIVKSPVILFVNATNLEYEEVLKLI